MPRPADLFRYVIALSSLIVFAVHAQGRTADMEEGDAQRWLRMIPLAAQSLDYSGIFTHRQGGQIYTSRITHVVQDGKVLEKLEVLDGRPREYVRRGEEILYYAPEEKTIRVEQRLTPEGFPALLSHGPERLLPYYRLQADEKGKVAGFDCQTLLLLPRDNLRYGYRLCVEESSGLLLQLQTMVDNKAIEQIGFTQLSLGEISHQLTHPTYIQVQDWRYERGVIEQVEMPSLKLGFLPSGFAQIATVRHTLSQEGVTAVNAVSQADRKQEMVQIVFSDGLAAISIFLEPRPQNRSESVAQQGAVNIRSKRLGDFWLTIVGEIPEVAVRKIVNSIEFKSHQ